MVCPIADCFFFGIFIFQFFSIQMQCIAVRWEMHEERQEIEIVKFSSYSCSDWMEAHMSRDERRKSAQQTIDGDSPKKSTTFGIKCKQI